MTFIKLLAFAVVLGVASANLEESCTQELVRLSNMLEDQNTALTSNNYNPQDLDNLVTLIANSLSTYYTSGCTQKSRDAFVASAGQSVGAIAVQTLVNRQACNTARKQQMAQGAMGVAQVMEASCATFSAPAGPAGGFRTTNKLADKYKQFIPLCGDVTEKGKTIGVFRCRWTVQVHWDGIGKIMKNLASNPIFKKKLEAAEKKGKNSNAMRAIDFGKAFEAGIENAKKTLNNMKKMASYAVNGCDDAIVAQIEFHYATKQKVEYTLHFGEAELISETAWEMKDELETCVKQVCHKMTPPVINNLMCAFCEAAGCIEFKDFHHVPKKGICFRLGWSVRFRALPIYTTDDDDVEDNLKTKFDFNLGDEMCIPPKVINGVHKAFSKIPGYSKFRAFLKKKVIA